MFRAKKIALAVAMAAATMSMAQATEVEVFGRIDTGMLYTANAGDSKDSFQMTSGHSTGSRWGIKATEKLNADWSVRAHLESGFESDTGELGYSGRIFGRQMTLSLKNKSFGEIAFGRSGKPLSGSDQFTRIRPFTPFGVTYGDAGLLFYAKGARIDNAVFYQSPKFAGFTVLVAASTRQDGQEAEEWTDNSRFWGGSLDWQQGNVGLMLGFMNREAYDKTVETGKVTFFSRTKNRLWTKGEESGNFLNVVSMKEDCDKDTLLIQVHPVGPVCHTGTDTCWGEKNEQPVMFLKLLQDFIDKRHAEMPEGSYTTSLFRSGVNKMAQKVGEEAVETVIEACNGTDERLIYEGADLLYHLIVLLTSKGYRIEDLARELEERHSADWKKH